MHRKGYLEFLKKLDKPDHLGLEKIMLVMAKMLWKNSKRILEDGMWITKN